jgi:hypothetical protein
MLISSSAQQQLPRRGIVTPIKFGSQLGQASTQARRCGGPAPGVVQMPLHRSRQLPLRIVQHRGDLPQREPEAAQQADPIQPGDIASRVHPVASVGPPRRRQQADVIVVVQGPDRQARGPGQGSDLPRLLGFAAARQAAAHASTVEPHAASGARPDRLAPRGVPAGCGDQ